MQQTSATETEKHRGQNRRGDTVGLAVRATLRAQVLADIGLDTAILRRTVQTQVAALDAMRKDRMTPNWPVRLRAAADLQALGVPRETHGNTSGTDARVLVEFPEWFKALAERRTTAPALPAR